MNQSGAIKFALEQRKAVCMFSIIRVAGIALVGFASFPPNGTAFAQGTAPTTELPRVPGQIPAQAEPGGDGIAANGRCGGVSTGTGERRCGDASGGPSGGNDTKN